MQMCLYMNVCNYFCLTKHISLSCICICEFGGTLEQVCTHRGVWICTGRVTLVACPSECICGLQECVCVNMCDCSCAPRECVYDYCAITWWEFVWVSVLACWKAGLLNEPDFLKLKGCENVMVPMAISRSTLAPVKISLCFFALSLLYQSHNCPLPLPRSSRSPLLLSPRSLPMRC